ncbi:MAG: 4Fe-4S dicluster domain-containing protein [Dissulfurispiraceae bacterium]|jgi:molybdopterin-containing oxidoreductase family iron-sulfur binding subunit|nr:4Fe-4S dicluster domain-containing protein [Dissulfurispiraceae bacterium]
MKKQYTIVIDLRRCFGCNTCTVACRMENSTNSGVLLSEVHTIGSSWNKSDVPAGKFPNLKMYYLPVMCNHCADPACKKNLPAQIEKRDDGVVYLKDSKGSQAQESACPYNRIKWDAKSKQLQKCDLCMSRVTEGLRPLCVESCPAKARHFGDLNDPNSEVSKLVKEFNAKPLFPDLGTKPSVRYIMPRGSEKKAVGDSPV